MWYENDIPKGPSLSSSFFPPGRMGDSLPSIKLSYLTPSTWSAWIFPFGAQTPGSSDYRLHQCYYAPMSLTFVVKTARRNWPVRSQYAISANLYFNPSFSVLWYYNSIPETSELMNTVVKCSDCDLTSNSGGSICAAVDTALAVACSGTAQVGRLCPATSNYKAPSS
jgi:hypothetical protein